MSSSNVLSARDVNAPMHGAASATTEADGKPDVMSMEHHRQVFQSKMEQGEYVATVLSAMMMIMMLTVPRQEQNLHLPLGQHHEPLHRQAVCLPQQAGWEVRLLPLPSPHNTPAHLVLQC